jgi:hypothetical protein
MNILKMGKEREKKRAAGGESRKIWQQMLD